MKELALDDDERTVSIAREDVDVGGLDPQLLFVAPTGARVDRALGEGNARVLDSDEGEAGFDEVEVVGEVSVELSLGAEAELGIGFFQFMG